MSPFVRLAIWIGAMLVAVSTRAQMDSASWLELAGKARDHLVKGVDGLESARAGSLEAREAGKALGEAERLYNQLIEGAPASDEELAMLHLNRGTSRLARGDAPGALYDFKRANMLMPGDLLIESRVRAARHMLEGGGTAEITEPPITLGDQARALAWRGVRLAPSEWRLNAVVGAGGAFWVFVGAAVLGFGGRARRVRRVCALGAAACGVVALAATAITAFEHTYRPPANEVVVLASDCRSYREPGEVPADVKVDSEFRGEAIRRGTELVIIGSDDLSGEAGLPPAWLKVRPLDAAATASPMWVRAVDVGFVDRGR